MVGKVFRVIFARSARQKLRQMHEYNDRQVSAEYARKVSRGLVSESRKLTRLPQSKPLLPTQRRSDPPYRYAKRWSIKIIFRVFSKGDEVRVVDFLHDAEDPQKWEDL